MQQQVEEEGKRKTGESKRRDDKMHHTQVLVNRVSLCVCVWLSVCALCFSYNISYSLLLMSCVSFLFWFFELVDARLFLLGFSLCLLREKKKKKEREEVSLLWLVCSRVRNLVLYCKIISQLYIELRDCTFFPFVKKVSFSAS